MVLQTKANKTQSKKSAPVSTEGMSKSYIHHFALTTKLQLVCSGL